MKIFLARDRLVDVYFDTVTKELVLRYHTHPDIVSRFAFKAIFDTLIRHDIVDPGTDLFDV